MRCSLVVGLLVIATVGAHAASAASIDDSTVRVFAIGTVSADSVELHGRAVTIANGQGGHGTGFVVDGGLVMTAHHVIEGARHVVVRLPGKGGFFAARVVYSEKDNDIALLALDAGGDHVPTALALDHHTPRVRGTVFAIGYPIDASRTQPQSARGIIAGFLDDGTVQLDMSLNPGNSGGPIVDEHDAVVGMAIARGAVEKGVQGIGYAVPVPKLLAALAEARRHVQSGEATSGVAMSRDSATVVDEVVQHGAFYELRKTANLGANATTADVEQALASLVARISDPDLLVFMAGTLWNAAVVLEESDDSERPATITRDQALAVAARLRQSSSAAARRAVQLDASVASRSSFVQVALADPGATPAAAAGGQVYVFTGNAVSTTTSGRAPIEVALRGAPEMRFNPATGTTGVGYGVAASLAFPSAGAHLIPMMGLALGSVGVTGMSGDQFDHLMLAADFGLVVRLGKLDMTGVIAPVWYRSSVNTAANNGQASAFAMSAGLALGYHIGWLELGTAARALSGPTVWVEPLNLSVVF